MLIEGLFDRNCNVKHSPNMKTNSEGIKEWDLVFGGADRNRAHTVHQTRDGGYIVVGAITSNGSEGDVWLVKLAPDRPRTDLTVNELEIIWWVSPVGLLLLYTSRKIRKKDSMRI